MMKIRTLVINCIVIHVFSFVRIVYSCRQIDIYGKLGKHNVVCLLSNYKNVTDVHSISDCAVLCIRKAKCQTMNYNSVTRLCCLGNAMCQEAEYAPGFEMLVIGQELKQGTSCVTWRRLDIRGVTRTVQYMGVGSLSEVVKATMNDGQILPGWKAVAGSKAYVIHDGRPKLLSNYETLTVHSTCAVLWQVFDGNVIPEDAIIGGDRYGVTLYIARTTVSSAGQLAYVGGYLNAKLRKMFYVDFTTPVTSTTNGIEILILIWIFWTHIYVHVVFKNVVFVPKLILWQSM